MIPGFDAYTHELLGDPYLKNDKMFNPYSSAITPSLLVM